MSTRKTSKQNSKTKPRASTRTASSRPTKSGATKSGATRTPRGVSVNTIERHKRQIPGRLARIRADRSQRSFARELGVFQQNVNRYVNGTTPPADFLITLAVQEDISLDWLLLGRGTPKPKAGRESRR